MIRGAGRPVKPVLRKDDIEQIRAAWLVGKLPSFSAVAKALGVSRSLVGKIVSNRIHYSGQYATELVKMEQEKQQWLTNSGT